MTDETFKRIHNAVDQLNERADKAVQEIKEFEQKLADARVATRAEIRLDDEWALAYMRMEYKAGMVWRIVIRHVHSNTVTPVLDMRREMKILAANNLPLLAEEIIRRMEALTARKDAQEARRLEMMKNIHIGTHIGDDVWVALCGVADPKYLTGWPDEILSPNGPSGCMACIRVHAENRTKEKENNKP